MMTTRYFTLEEANALLVELRPLMTSLLERRARVVRLSQEAGELLTDLFSDVGGSLTSAMTLDFMAIEKLLGKIQSYGCVVKDLNAGLLDFLTERDGREVYLCWRYNEPEIQYYHELHSGFNGRRPV
jgi:hypothetical protein